MHGARPAALASFHQPRRAITIGAPEAAAFPTGVRIVDASVETFGVEPHWIWNAQHDHLAVFQRHKAIVEVGGGNRDVLAEPERIVLIDPGIIARLDASVFEAFKAGPGYLCELLCQNASKHLLVPTKRAPCRRCILVR